MAYDALAESLRLIESGLPAQTEVLSRRRRFVPLAVDVDDNAAVTVFARRGARTDWLETHLLYRREGEWSLHGGGASSIHFDEIGHSWASESGEPHARRTGGVSVDVNARRRMPWGARWAHSAWVEVASDVRAVAVGSRVIEVPWHRNVAIVWVGRRAPLAKLLGDRDLLLAELDLSRPR